MKLDKNHLDQFENISPPMRHALTIPVEIRKPLAGVHLYVCCSTFNQRGTRVDVLDVATALRVLGEEEHAALSFACELIMNTPGGNQHHADVLARLKEGA